MDLEGLVLQAYKVYNQGLYKAYKVYILDSIKVYIMDLEGLYYGSWTSKRGIFKPCK